MNPEDRDNVVVCPNCKSIFCMAYVMNHKCPHCGCGFEPWDTMAGCPIKDEQSQLMYARAVTRE